MRLADGAPSYTPPPLQRAGGNLTRAGRDRRRFVGAVRCVNLRTRGDFFSVQFYGDETATLIFRPSPPPDLAEAVLDDPGATMPVASGAPPSSPMASGAEPKTGGRRVSKPLMEKRRRARINRCLNQLKAFLVDPSKPESPRQSKLEKADILEMTVCHLQALHRQRRTARLLDDPEVRHKFRAGFEECILEIRRFLCSLAEQQHQATPCFDPVASRERILGHLQRRAREIQDPDGTLAQCTSAAASPDAGAIDPPVRPSRRFASTEAGTPGIVPLRAFVSV
ncbi:hypothetical protein HPB50_010495 [Hyalomma asiaticum]|uniref:Uncharacterized protein n=1 Tax=Hyalomma asiaticum TaxID=266040 RepID=A0ACB7SIA9_HYAAI|nr:hypothetical protein HPB50_010495 [Hyalomma asiaticum]